MHPLYQRLRELDWDTFQRLAFQLLSTKHPGLKIRHVEGAGGDRGLDLFEGQLKGHLTIWQCKHFPNGLGPKQRPQVKESLRAALKYFKPAQWVLVLSIDLDRKGHEWFQKLQTSYSQKTRVGLFQAADIVRELIHRRDIRDAFFPGAVFDTITAARALKGLGGSTSEQVEQLAKEQMDELIARLEEADARFDYQIVYGPNVGAELAETPPDHPLLVASVLDENKRIDVFARDIDALTLDPPEVNFTIKGSGVAKFQEFLRTGKRQEFETDEVSTASSTLDFLLSEKQATGWKVVLMPPASLAKKVFSLRVTFSNTSEQVRYELVQFRVSSAGTEQVEIESISPLPFVLYFSLPLVRGIEGSFTVQERFQGGDVQAVSKAIRAISLLRGGGNIELYALEVEKPLGTLSLTTTSAEQREKWEAMISDAARVSEIFNVDLRVPKRITNDDLRSLTILMAIGQGERLPFGGLNAELVKSAACENAVSSAIGKKLQLILQVSKLDPPPVLFGTAVNTGPISLIVSEASIDNEQEFMDRYKNAKYGDSVAARFDLKDVRAELGGPPAARVYIKPAEA
jgi:hypothetical protein